MKAKILNVMDVYLLSKTLFCREESKCQFSPEIWSQIIGVKMISERQQHHNVMFTQRLVGLLVKSVDFSNLCCIIYQW